jgi:hypothetical protein
MTRISMGILVALFSLSATADPEQAESGPPENLDVEAAAAEQAAIAEALNNPLSSLWIMFIQNDTTLYEGDLVEGIRHINGMLRVDLLAGCVDRPCRPVEVSIY